MAPEDLVRMTLRDLLVIVLARLDDLEHRISSRRS